MGIAMRYDMTRAVRARERTNERKRQIVVEGVWWLCRVCSADREPHIMAHHSDAGSFLTIVMHHLSLRCRPWTCTRLPAETTATETILN